MMVIPPVFRLQSLFQQCTMKNVSIHAQLQLCVIIKPVLISVRAIPQGNS